MKSSADRRKKVRVPVQSQIKHSQYQVLGTPIFQENSAIDLSSGGISFETERDYQKGNLVLLEVKMEGDALKLLVCVAWVKKKKTGAPFEVGAELIAVDPVDKRRMQGHLNKMISQVQSEKQTVAKKKAVAKKKTVTNKKTAQKSPLKKSHSKKRGSKLSSKKSAPVKKPRTQKPLANKSKRS